MPPLDEPTRTWIERATGATVRSAAPLAGGCIADVLRIDLDDAPPVVLKRGDDSLAIEADMLRTLAERSELPVPRVVAEAPAAILVEHVTAGGSLTDRAQAHAADLLAALHSITPHHHAAAGPDGQTFGFERHTLIGPLHQPNDWAPTWLDFFRDNRLLHMTRLASDHGALPHRLRDRLERFAADLTESDCPPPAGARGPHGRLLHGDCWTGNVLVAPDNSRIAAFIDPAVYYGSPEIELAFTTLFGTFSRPFFDRYAERSDAVADWPGFFDRRRDLYNLYPLLVHVRLFGAGYLTQLTNTLDRVN